MILFKVPIRILTDSITTAYISKLHQHNSVSEINSYLIS